MINGYVDDISTRQGVNIWNALDVGKTQCMSIRVNMDCTINVVIVVEHLKQKANHTLIESTIQKDTIM